MEIPYAKRALSPIRGADYEISHGYFPLLGRDSPAVRCQCCTMTNPAMVQATPLPGHPHVANGFYRQDSVVCREEGKVILQIAIDATGSVTGSRLVASSGYPDLDTSAAGAVLTWRYVPATLSGKPISSHNVVAVVFRAGNANSMVGYALDYAMSLGCRAAKFVMSASHPRSR